jgi:hypothetical protein
LELTPLRAIILHEGDMQRRRMKHTPPWQSASPNGSLKSRQQRQRFPTQRLREVNVMTQPTEQEIKKRAYEIWERSGKPEGREDEFWQQAEQELRNEDKSSPLRTPDTL